MNWSIPAKQLKSLGYTFQKMYAADYKCYHKKLSTKSNITLWLWVAGKTIEVNDWHQFTGSVIEFYKANKDQSDGVSDIGIKIQLNRETGYIQLYDYKSYYEVFESKSWDSWKEKYDDWQEIYLSHDGMKLLFKEIDILTK